MTPYKDRSSNKRLAIIDLKILKILKSNRITLPLLAKLNRLLELHTDTNLDKFNKHQLLVFKGTKCSKFGHLLHRANEINHFVYLRAIPLTGATQKQVKSEKIDSQHGIRIAVKSLLAKVRNNPVAIIKSMKPVSRTTLTNCSDGNQTPNFNTLMNICLLNGYSLQICILPYSSSDRNTEFS